MNDTNNNATMATSRDKIANNALHAMDENETAATLVYYADTSALAKLVTAEQESQALRDWIAAHVTPGHGNAQRIDNSQANTELPGSVDHIVHTPGSTAVLCSSDVVRTELSRVVLRNAPQADAGALMLQAQAVLDRLVLLRATPDIFAAAGRLMPTTLRSLDAIHLASALDLGDALTGLLTYDERLAQAARLNGINVVMPGI